jgi:hypothetical protein
LENKEMERKICYYCKHFKGWNTRQEEKYDGECRFNPPVVLETKAGKIYREYTPGHWPSVLQSQWCGKFEEK